MSPTFLTVDVILDYHAEQLAMFGGADGVRDLSLLESAAGQPMTTSDGAYLHTTLHSMAAAYLFHIVQNHPFVDGNKRTGLVSALAFLELNGIETSPTHRLYELTVAVASGTMTKGDLAEDLYRLFPPGR